MFKVELCANEWQVVADFGNPDFEVGDIIESGFSTRDEAQAAIDAYSKPYLKTVNPPPSS